jgi:hypothetical protein
MRTITKSLMGGAALATVLLAGTSSGSAGTWVWSSFSGWMTCDACVGGQKTHTFSNPTETITAQTLWGKIPSNIARHNALGYYKPWTDYVGPTSVGTYVELDCSTGTTTATATFTRDEDWNETWGPDEVKCANGGYLRRSRLKVGRFVE